MNTSWTTTSIFQNQNIIGTCSICKGAVTVPSIWHGISPPTPTCSSCGAIAAPDYGPEIRMVPNPVKTNTTYFFKWVVDEYQDSGTIKFKNMMS